MPFQMLGLGPKIVRAIQQSGYTEPTPIQSKAIPEILRGHDVIGVAQTGTGKTAAFVLPMLEKLSEAPPATAKRKIRALVVVPTRELAVQVEQNVRKYGAHLHLRSATVYGGVGEQPQIAALRNGVDLVVATPGRLLDLTRSGHLDYTSVEFAVLDEADRMLDMGFLPDIRRIVNSLPRKRQTLLFSATFSQEIQKTANEFLKSPKVIEVGKRAAPAEGVAQFVYKVPRDHKIALINTLLEDPTYGSVLVFARTRHGADKLARQIERKGVATGTLHSNRTQNQRLEALRKFKSGAVRVLVATDIAARGIDVVGISHVINFDFPPQAEDYVHRIGRTGRAHAIGEAISFVTADDETALRALERFLGRGIPRREVKGLRVEETQPTPSSWKPSESRGARPSDRRPGGQSHSRPRSNERPQAGRDDRPSRGTGPSRPFSGARDDKPFRGPGGTPRPSFRGSSDSKRPQGVSSPGSFSRRPERSQPSGAARKPEGSRPGSRPSSGRRRP